MEATQEVAGHHVVGGVDTHKDLHVTAVVDDRDRVLGSQCFATTRQGYKQMLAWMRSFGTLQRIGVEATGTYGASALHAAGRHRSSRGHDTGQARPSQTRQKRRSRCPERCTRSLRWQAHCHAKKSRRHDRILTRAQGLPKDSCCRSAYSTADDLQHHRLRAGRTA